MREIWKPIKNFEGLYEVSNKGRIKKGEKLKSLRKNNKGYLLVDLYKNNVRHQYLVHRLVAQAFIQNDNNFYCVDSVMFIKDGVLRSSLGDTHHLQVIGNIHDNPELLGDK